MIGEGRAEDGLHLVILERTSGVIVEQDPHAGRATLLYDTNVMARVGAMAQMHNDRIKEVEMFGDVIESEIQAKVHAMRELAEALKLIGEFETFEMDDQVVGGALHAHSLDGLLKMAAVITKEFVLTCQQLWREKLADAMGY